MLDKSAWPGWVVRSSPMPTSTPEVTRRPASKATPCTGKPFPVVAVPGAPPSRRALFGEQEPLAEQLPKTTGGVPPAVGGRATPPPEPPSERQSTRTPADHGSRIGEVNGSPDARRARVRRRFGRLVTVVHGDAGEFSLGLPRADRRSDPEDGQCGNGGHEASARPQLAHAYLHGRGWREKCTTAASTNRPDPARGRASLSNLRVAPVRDRPRAVQRGVERLLHPQPLRRLEHCGAEPMRIISVSSPDGRPDDGASPPGFTFGRVRDTQARPSSTVLTVRPWLASRRGRLTPATVTAGSRSRVPLVPTSGRHRR